MSNPNLYSGHDLEVYLESKVYERVTAAATTLDEHFGDVNFRAPFMDRQDWWNMVELDTLDISSYFHCVLGQLFGIYSEGTRALRDYMEPDVSLDSAYSGFTFYGLENPRIVTLMNEEWARQIIKRQDDERAAIRAAIEVHPAGKGL